MLHWRGSKAFRHIVATATGTITMVGIALVGTAGPASAQGTRPCAEYSYCFYQDIKYGGWQLQYQATNFGDFNNPPYTTRTNIRDQVSSIINNTGRKICVYNNRTLQFPEVLTVRPYQDYINLVDVNFNDKADYWRLVDGSQTCPNK